MSSAENYRFHKFERIKSKRLIENLFSKGASFISYPLRVIYLEQEADLLFSQVAFSIPKKKIKQANQRNSIRRKIIEAYRLNKLNSLSTGNHYAIFFIYLGKEDMEYERIQDAVINGLAKISKKDV